MFNDHCRTYPGDVFQSTNKLNPVFMNDIFKTKDLSYQLRDNHTVYQPKFKGITYGKHTSAYYGNHIWNALHNQVKERTDLRSFKSPPKTWEGPNCQCNKCDVLNRM